MQAFDADVVIAGAGPAGTSAALVLARAGCRVLLIDAHDFPRDKACGDLLGSEAVAILGRLGLRETVLDGALPLSGAIVHGPNGTCAGAVGSARRAVRTGDARVLPRRVLDARLLAAALAAGATFGRARVAGVLRAQDGCVMGLRTSAGDVRARVTIGAEGWGSPVARALGATPPKEGYTALALRAYANGIPDLARRMHFFINAPGDGYAWIFPLGDGRANIGLGFIPGEPGAADLKAAFERFLGPGSAARALLGRTPPAARLTWPIPLGWQPGRYAAPGALLAGDAARLASPLSGAGIHHALASGSAAARFALRALGGDEGAWRAYGPWLHGRFAARLHGERLIHRYAGTPGRVGPWLALTRAVPGAGTVLSAGLLALG